MEVDMTGERDTIPLELTAILFDLDGTLLDSREMLVNTAYRTAKEFGLASLTEEELSQHFGMGFSKYLSDFGVDKEKIDTYFTTEKTEKYHLNIFFPKVKAGLYRLIEEGVLLGIVTNQQRSLVRNVLKKHQLDQLFDVVVTKDDVEKQKPAAEPILLAVEQLGMDKKQVLMVGDTKYDRISAKHAGVSFAHVNFYEAMPEQEGVYHFTDFHKLVAFILDHKTEGVNNQTVE